MVDILSYRTEAAANRTNTVASAVARAKALKKDGLDNAAIAKTMSVSESSVRGLLKMV